MAKKSSLGRGPSALTPDFSAEDLSNYKVEDIELELISANSYQPRTNFDSQGLEELAKSIEENGIIQPIVLRRIGLGYEIIAGERRFRAVKKLGYKTIPSLVRELDIDRASRLALVENIQREDLSLLEEALAYRTMLEEFGLTHEELARQVGKSRPYVSNAIRILDLTDESLEALDRDLITRGHGKLLLSLKDQALERKALKLIITGGLSVRQTERLLRDLTRKEKPQKTRDKDHQLRQLEDELMRSLGTRVNLKPGRKKSIIEIEYYSQEDLERILEILG